MRQNDRAMANANRHESLKLFDQNTYKELRDMDNRQQYYQGVNTKMADRATNFQSTKVNIDYQLDNRKQAMQY